MNPARITLTVPQGSREDKEYSFPEPRHCVIGRADDCDIQLARGCGYLDVSRHHCLLEIDPPHVQVRDLGSRNGTFVNDEKIGQRAHEEPPVPTDSWDYPARELKDGDEIRVGHAVLRVGIESDSEMPATARVPMSFV
jgi:pSer/pThr/pTyr-binding forkhead associated (FHA) protein